MSETTGYKFDVSTLNISTEQPPASPYDEELERAYLRAHDAVFKGEDDGWVFKTEKDGVKVWTKPPSDGCGIDYYKGQGRIKGTPEAIRALIVNLSTRREWDNVYSDGQTIEQIDTNTFIQYISFGAPWPVSTRDFCIAVRSVVIPTGEIFVYYANAEHPSCPEVKGNVRGELYFSVFCIRPIDDETCEIIYTAGNNPKGSIPGWLVNLSSTQQALLINSIGKLIETKPEVVKSAIDEQRQCYESFQSKKAD